MMENTGKSKVTKFDIVVGVQEDIGWFEVSMEYSFPVLSAMALFQSWSHLYQHFPHKIFFQISTKKCNSSEY